MPNLTASDLDARLLAWTRGDQGADTFEALILDVYRHQYAANAAYRRWCDRYAPDPEHVDDWRDIPAVPQVAFREWTLTTFPADQAVARFDSSGTTASRPSRHYLDTLALYEAALIPPFTQYVLPDGARLPCLALVPSPAAAPHSSLSHMAGVVGRECCSGDVQYYVGNDTVDATAFCRACAEAAGLVLIFTTAFALVHVLDYMDTEQLRCTLPPGSRVMETGGYKGRTRALPQAELYAWVTDRLGVADSHIVNEYGMCELSSQWYDTTLADAAAGRAAAPRRKVGPPWVRARVMDPETGGEAADGAVGLLRLYDPMNRGSVCCVQTEDLGRRVPGAFEILGRASAAELRGCSLELDTF